MEEQNQVAIKVENLSRNFGQTIAVNDISFSVMKGEIFGFLGPNGAGKTTTIRILTTLLSPSNGSAHVWGYNVVKDRDLVRKHIGIVFQDPSLDMDLTAKENLRFHGILYNMSENLIKERSKRLLDLIELKDWADKKVRTYSGGMRRRLEIIRALLHSPRIIFLDEPTLGLDPQSRRRIWDYLREINSSEGVTIFLTTHYMEEADQLCDRVAIIDKGKIVGFGNPTALKSMVGEDVITLDILQKNELKRFLKVIQDRQPFTILKSEILRGSLIIMCKHGENAIPQLMNIAVDLGLTINSVGLKKPGLDDVFLYFTGKQIREEGAEHMPMSRMQMKKMMRGAMKHG
ncbi:MAG: ATP-binding cassette domain-containing protein [Promethearchaeota archaeon]